MNPNMKASSWYLFGNLFDKAIAFLTIPIFTRMVSTEEYGIFNTYISWVTILAIVLGLSMESSLQTAYSEFKEDLDSFTSTIALSGVAFTLLFTIVVLGGTVLFHVNVSPVMVILALLQGIMTYVLNVAKMYYMMQVKYLKRVVLMSVPHTLIAFLSVWGVMLCTEEKYWGLIIPYILVITSFGIVMLILFVLKAKNKFNISYFRYAIVFSAPIIFHALSLQILAQADKIMLTSMRSASETGVYSLIYNVGLIAQVITNALDSAWLPWYQKKINMKDQSKTINKNASRIIVVVAFITTGIVIVAPEVVKILASEEYWSGIPMVVPVVLATYVMFLYTLEVHTEYVYKRTKQIPLYTIVAALSNIVLNMVLIPKFGATAAAYTTLFSYSISFILHYMAAHKCNKEVLTMEIFARPSIMVLIGSALMIICMNQWIIRWVVAIALGIIFVLYIYKKNLFKTLLSD